MASSKAALAERWFGLKDAATAAGSLALADKAWTQPHHPRARARRADARDLSAHHVPDADAEQLRGLVATDACHLVDMWSMGRCGHRRR